LSLSALILMPTDFQHRLPRLQRRKLICLITSGQTTLETTPATEEFARLLNLAQAAVKANIDILQIRERTLSARVLYALTADIAKLTHGTNTRLLVNDRADIAASAGADGVHLAASSLPAHVVRKAFGDDFLIGVSTHSVAQAVAARTDGADFAVFGPVFSTPSKEEYGEPQGLKQLERVTNSLGDFPVLALGGISVDRVADCIIAGAQGVAAIRMLNDPSQLERTVARIREHFEQGQDVTEKQIVSKGQSYPRSRTK
jgi:thiamine-phosphate pyrophosphorylase